MPPLARITKHVTPLILRSARHAPTLHVPILAIDEPNAIAKPSRILRQWTPEPEEDGTRAVGGITRLDARQECGVRRADISQRQVALRRAGRQRHQRGRRRRSRAQRLLGLPRRLLLLLGLLGWKLAATRERDGAEPVAVRRVAIRARLEGRVRVATACDSEQAGGKVGEVVEEGRRQVVGHVRRVVCERRRWGCREWRGVRRSWAVRQRVYEWARERRCTVHISARKKKHSANIYMKVAHQTWS